MVEIIGKWVQIEGQPYQGLWFEFKADGSFRAEHEPMGIVSGGSYSCEDDQITLQQSEHTLGFVGEFKGRFAIEGNQLKMAIAAGPGEVCPADLSDARIYNKEA
jgi:hypothetical protein